MRYLSKNDAQLMRRRSMDPSIMVRRHMQLSGLTTAVGGATGLLNIGKGSTVQSAASGVSSGAAIGSVFGPVGMGIGALVGGVTGVVASAFNRQDQEVQNFDQAQAIAKQSGPAAVINIANKYLVLAGLFDLEAKQIKGNIPFYKKYGRMGEQRFVSDMCGVVQAAANAGAITDNDTPQTVYAKIVLPWINQMGFGSFSDSNAEMIGYILMGMIAEYCGGVYASRWYARGGDMPFGSLHPFTLPQPVQASQPQVTASPTPSPQAVTPTQATASQVPAELQRYQNGVMPAAGATINYAFAGKATMSFLALPHPMQFVGVDNATAAWIVSYQGDQYELQGSTLVPYTAPQTASTQTKSQLPTTPVPDNTSQLVSATDQQGQNVPAQYIPSGGGGGGYYQPPPTTLPALAASNSAGLSTGEEIGIGAVLLVGVLIFMSQKHGR